MSQAFQDVKNMALAGGVKRRRASPGYVLVRSLEKRCFVPLAKALAGRLAPCYVTERFESFKEATEEEKSGPLPCG